MLHGRMGATAEEGTIKGRSGTTRVWTLWVLGTFSVGTEDAHSTGGRMNLSKVSHRRATVNFQTAQKRLCSRRTKTLCALAHHPSEYPGPIRTRGAANGACVFLEAARNIG